MPMPNGMHGIGGTPASAATPGSAGTAACIAGTATITVCCTCRSHSEKMSEHFMTLFLEHLQALSYSAPGVQASQGQLVCVAQPLLRAPERRAETRTVLRQAEDDIATAPCPSSCIMVGIGTDLCLKRARTRNYSWTLNPKP